MSQRDVIDFLKKHKGRWFTALEINQQINKNSTAIALKKLRHSNLIDMKMEPRGRNSKYQYRWKG